MATWQSKSFPDGCRHCATTDRRCLGRGLCSKCYQNLDIRALYDPVVGRQMIDDDEMAPNPEVSTAPDEATPRPVASSDEVESPYSPGERQPGGGSPSPPGAGAPGKKRGFFSRFKKDMTAPGYLPPTKEKRPKVAKSTGRRISGADTLSDIWTGAGSLAVQTGHHAPLGRCLQFQAPVAGEMLDEAIKGSFVDRAVLQPIVKARGRFDLVGAVFGPPVLVYSMERAMAAGDRARFDMLGALLKSSIRQGLPLMVPAIKKVKMKEAAAAEAAAELFPDLPEGVDPVDAIIADMFATWVPVTVTEPEPEEASVP